MFKIHLFCIIVFTLYGCIENSVKQKKDRNSLSSEKEVYQGYSLNWLDPEKSRYYIQELKMNKGHRNFEIHFENNHFKLELKRKKDQNFITISKGEKVLLSKKIELLTTLHIGTAIIDNKELLLLETSENGPLIYNIVLDDKSANVTILAREKFFKPM